MNAGIGLAMGNQIAGKLNQPDQNSGSTPPPLPAESSYYLAINGQQSGPFTISTLTQMAQQGSLQKESLVWKAGMPQWTVAKDVGELTTLFNSVPPPLPI
jgi:hypothetical protein